MKKRILIVEDDPFTQQFYRMLFAKTEYLIFFLEGAIEIFDFISQKVVDLLMLDVNLANCKLDGKKISGVELSRMIKQNRETSFIPILIVSAVNIQPGNKTLLKDSLADDFLPKPIDDYNVLLRKVQKLMEKYGQNISS